MKIDLRALGIEKAFADMLKADFTNEVKEYLRENKQIKGNDYVQVARNDYRKPATYSKEDQAEIDKFIAEKGFKKIQNPLQEEYSVEIIATQKAKNEAMKILLNAIENANSTISKSASKVANKK